MRGSATDRFQVVEDGILLLSAVPHREQPLKSQQGPSSNLKFLLQNKISLTADFRIKFDPRITGRGWIAQSGFDCSTCQVAANKTKSMIKLTAAPRDSLGEMKLRDNKWLIPYDVADFTFAD